MTYEEQKRKIAEELQLKWDDSTHDNADDLMNEFAEYVLTKMAEAYKNGRSRDGYHRVIVFEELKAEGLIP